MKPARLYTDAAHISAYSQAACIFRIKPRGILYPKEDDDVCSALLYAKREGVSLTGRGGGSGLAGQTLGRGLILDFSPYFNKIISVDKSQKKVKVNPGTVLARLNMELKNSGLCFAPDPSSSPMCTIGGMLSNNSKGAHSLLLGNTLQNTEKIKFMMADGGIIELENKPKAVDSYPRKDLRSIGRLILKNRERILQNWPLVEKNSSGYNLRGCIGEGKNVNLVPLFVGSEGTLCIFLEAELKLTELPRSTSLSLIEFSSLENVASSIPQAFKFKPSAMELLDETFINIMKEGFAGRREEFHKDTKAIMLVETTGDCNSEASERLENIIKSLDGITGVRTAKSKDESEYLWSFRKAASPLLNRGRGRLKSTRFIEDGAVPVSAIPDYFAGIKDIMRRYNLEVVIFGHAGDSSFHANPFMDLKNPDHFRIIDPIACEVSELIASLKGSLTGEHGDGRARTPYLRHIYGSLVDLFIEIKEILDPEGILNPGIIASREVEPIGKNLRYNPSYKAVQIPGFLSDESLITEMERCHGCGQCRDWCPTYLATSDELLSPRGRADILQSLLKEDITLREIGSGNSGKAFDTCIACSICAVSCPTGVDIAPLSASLRSISQTYFSRFRYSLLGDIPPLMVEIAKMPRLAKILVPILSIKPPSLLTRLFGLSDNLPAVNINPSFFEEVTDSNYNGFSSKKAILFYGCYGSALNPDGESLLALRLLRRLGIETIVPEQKCCGIAKITKGLISDIEPDIMFNINSFLPYIKAGFEVVGTAPSCILAMKREWQRFYPSSETRLISEHCHDIFSYLSSLLLDGSIKPPEEKIDASIVFQTPCHTRVLDNGSDYVTLLKLIPQLKVNGLTHSCCGLSGSFGLLSCHQALSEGISERLMRELESIHAESIITPCGSCRAQLERHGQSNVIHPIGLLAKAYGIISLSAVK